MLEVAAQFLASAVLVVEHAELHFQLPSCRPDSVPPAAQAEQFPMFSSSRLSLRS